MRRSTKSTVTVLTMALMVWSPLSLSAADRPELEFDGRDWELGYQASNCRMQIEEYVLVGESVCCWSELVTWQYFAGWQGREGPRELMRLHRHQKMIRNPTVEWEILSEDFISVLYAWQIENDPAVGDYFELTRIIKSSEGLHVFHYATQDAEIFSANLGSWEESFKKIEVPR